MEGCGGVGLEMAMGFPSEKNSEDDEEEEEEEEQLVVMELSGIIDTDFLEKCDNKCKILGIDTAKPILQVDKYVFAGEYTDAVGSCVVFEEDTDHVETRAGSSNDSKPRLKYKCHTVRKLNMTRTFLIEKKEGEGSAESGVEFLQIKDNDFCKRPNMICNFLQEEEEVEAAPLIQDQSMVDVEGDGGNLDLNYEPENTELQMEGSVVHSDTSGLESEICVPSQTPDLSLEVAPDG
ncbi:general transcription factor 3C polypeptide 6 isoform X2 [Microcaecilia unicolor]|uniref:General transcription factor 3C polypeptide 6 n=1 Tax=Microcaecilia unicolor TaxID=1415580 RepID=A0A6P7ZA77_9AMPH|nr:general transcription factor 3C polypeptide 6 isoform X2 [Microcaecilia unicolor]